jgi:flagellar hook-length control protein FliK
MNNGSLLDSLLATSPASTAHKKPNRAQTAATSNNDFHNTLEQLRPKVAVTRPAQPSPHAIRATPVTPDKTPVNRDVPAQVSTSTSEALKTTKAHKAAGAGSATETREPLERETLAAELPFNEQQMAQKSLLAGILDGTLVIDLKGNSVLNGDGVLTENADDALLLAEAGLIDILPASLLPASMLPPELQAEAILPPAFANQITTALGVSAATTGAASPLSSMTVNTSPGGQLNLTGELALSPEGDTELGLAEGDMSDNPDLLLLNAKSILNKLVEANAGQLDKAAPAGDIKTLTATTPAIESLSRLSEAQSPAARAFVVQTGVPVTVGQPQWGQAVGERVLWLAAQNVSSAEIRLDPPELGPMQVRVSVNQDQVNVSFTSPHPAVRDVLDQQLNRLREMFAEQGLNLVNVDVSDKSFAQQHQEKDESNKSASSSQLEEDEAAPLASSIIMSNRLVDHYA